MLFMRGVDWLFKSCEPISLSFGTDEATDAESQFDKFLCGCSGDSSLIVPKDLACG